jgi:hypothetical protein
MALLAMATLASTTGSPSPTSAPGPARDAVALADTLRRLYAGPGLPGERWRGRPPEVVLDDGTTAPREAAYRDRPAFVAAARELIRTGTGDDPLLGAWLLGTVPVGERGEALGILLEALRHADPRVRFEAARVLGTVGPAPAIPSLLALESGAVGRAKDGARLSDGSGDALESAAALWAARRIALREGLEPPPPSSASAVGLAKGFCRGVSWWLEEEGGDAGASSFRALRYLGVDWISIHSWDPLQRDVHSPGWAAPRRPPMIPNLGRLVANAHAAGLKVMVKPHLEMRGYEPTPDEIRIFRGTDDAARRKLLERLRKQTEGRPRVWHNDIEMKTEDDWQAWFIQYEGYILAYARKATEAGVDAFCVGRETDKAAIAREADWRRLIARVREVFKGPLTYSANFDGYARIGFWDALDVIGISAYFPLAEEVEVEPTPERLAAAWDEIMAPLEAFARKANRRVVFTEIGYPAVPSAARRPWDDARGPADVWVQGRLYEAALRAVSRRPFLTGTFFWLWEGVARPPFRDASFSIQDKPASFVMARWYGGEPPRP